MSEISVIIPVGYDHADLLSRALVSVSSGTALPREVVVVDDHAAPPVAAMGWPNIAVRYCPLKHGRGRSSARNFGAKCAASPWIFFLDADDQLEATAIQDLRGVIAEGGVDAVFADYLRTRGQDTRTIQHQPWSLGRLRECWDANIGLLLRRDRFLAVGGFDESLEEGEEWDMMLRYASNPQIIVRKNTRPLIHVIDGRSTPRVSRTHGATASPSLVTRDHEVVMAAKARIERGEYQEWANR